MKANDREAAALAKLLKVSRSRAEEAGRRAAELEYAREKTAESLRLLADAISSEEAAAHAAEIVGFVHLAGFLAGASAKRDALRLTLQKIDEELAAARSDLEATYAETRKFEHVVEIARTAADKRLRRRNEAAVNAVAVMRFARRSKG